MDETATLGQRQREVQRGGGVRRGRLAESAHPQARDSIGHRREGDQGTVPAIGLYRVPGGAEYRRHDRFGVLTVKRGTGAPPRYFSLDGNRPGSES